MTRRNRFYCVWCGCWSDSKILHRCLCPARDAATAPANNPPPAA